MDLHEQTGIVDQLVETENILGGLDTEQHTVDAELDALHHGPEPRNADHAERIAILESRRERITLERTWYQIDERIILNALHPGA